MSGNQSAQAVPGLAIQLPSTEVQEKWQPARSVPFRLAVAVPLPGLTLRNLRTIRAGTVLLTNTPAAEDVPVTVAGALLGWGELDNVNSQMALRLTRLA